MFSLATGLLLGLLLGMRHAVEPDHLAAISVLVTRRKSAAGGMVLGALWGLGHTASLFAVGCILAVLDARLPTRIAEAFELLVAVMLVTLGTRALVRTARAASPSFDHDREPSEPPRVPRQPLIVGLIHGLAGSGALTALVLARLPTAITRLIYIALFGFGSVVGMACLTGLAGWPLAHVDPNSRLLRRLSAATGTLSLVLGSFWGWSAVRGLIGA